MNDSVDLDLLKALPMPLAWVDAQRHLRLCNPAMASFLKLNPAAAASIEDWGLADRDFAPQASEVDACGRRLRIWPWGQGWLLGEAPAHSDTLLDLFAKQLQACDLSLPSLAGQDSASPIFLF